MKRYNMKKNMRNMKNSKTRKHKRNKRTKRNNKTRNIHKLIGGEYNKGDECTICMDKKIEDEAVCIFNCASANQHLMCNNCTSKCIITLRRLTCPVCGTGRNNIIPNNLVIPLINVTSNGRNYTNGHIYTDGRQGAIYRPEGRDITPYIIIFGVGLFVVLIILNLFSTTSGSRYSSGGSRYSSSSKSNSIIEDIYIMYLTDTHEYNYLHFSQKELDYYKNNYLEMFQEKDKNITLKTLGNVVIEFNPSTNSSFLKNKVSQINKLIDEEI